MRRKVLWAAGLIALTLLLAACAPEASQDTLEPAGSPAREQKDIFVAVFWVAVGVFVIVQGGIVVIMIRYRHRKGRDRIPPQIHGNTRLEVGWTILPAVVLAFVMVPTVSMIWDLARQPSADALNVTVKGFQWWWGFEYTDDDMRVSYGDQDAITLADVLVVPEDREVYLTLEAAGGLIGDPEGDAEAADYVVIHSFWAPRLFGKQDVMPATSRTNHILFTADEPGTYFGQCAEFCGLQHTRMKFRIEVLSQSSWESWVDNQRLSAAVSTDPQAREGMDLFMNPLTQGTGSCVNCHAIGGTDAGGVSGPNLTHFADPTHSCFAGCNWDTTDREALEAWLRDPDAVKLGSKMPSYELSEEQIDALVVYLSGLR